MVEARTARREHATDRNVIAAHVVVRERQPRARVQRRRAQKHHPTLDHVHAQRGRLQCATIAWRNTATTPTAAPATAAAAAAAAAAATVVGVEKIRRSFRITSDIFARKSGRWCDGSGGLRALLLL